MNDNQFNRLWNVLDRIADNLQYIGIILMITLPSIMLFTCLGNVK